MKHLILIILSLSFIACEEQVSSEAENLEPRVTIVEGNNETVIESQDIETLLSLNPGDYYSVCEDSKIVLIEIKEIWNGERVDVVEMNHSDEDCTNHVDSTFTTFTSDEFYGDYVIEKDGDTYFVDGLEFNLQ